jgi:hypothetical protein
MNLHSPEFEAALQNGVRQAVQNDPELLWESRRSRKTPNSRWSSWFYRLGTSIFLAVLVYRTVEATGRVDAGLMVFDLWVLTLTLWFMGRMATMPYSSSDIPVLRLLPVSESTIFSWEWDKFLKASLFYLSDVAVGFITIGYLFHLSLLQWAITVALVPLTWAYMLALAALGAGRFPRLPYGVALGFLYLVWFLLLVGTQYSFPLLLAVIDYTAPTFSLVPTAWPLALFHLLLPGGGWIAGLLILPIGLVLSSFKDSIRFLRGSFVYYEPIFEEVPDLVPENDFAETASTDAIARPNRPIGTTAIAEGILSGQFLRQDEWKQGWLERELWHWFNKREKALAEFAFPSGITLTKPWKKILRNFLIITVLGFIASMGSLSLEFGIFAIGIIILTCQAMIPMLSTGASFRVIRISGLSIPAYAPYPITFRDLSRFLLKCSAIQMPWFTLLMMGSMALLTRVSGLTIAMSLIIGINASIVFWGARLFLLVFEFSSGSNDSSTVSLRSLALFVFFALFGLLFLILAVFSGVFSIVGAGSGILPVLQPILWIGCLLALLDGYVFFWIYGLFYRFGRFDLVR